MTPQHVPASVLAPPVPAAKLNGLTPSTGTAPGLGGRVEAEIAEGAVPIEGAGVEPR